MNRKITNNKLVNQLIELGACVIVPLILMELYFAVTYKVHLWNIYALATTWNDDVVYYKQLTGVLKYGCPQGYFGYNESYASIGTFGFWGATVIYIYAFFGWIFGIQPNTWIYCNVLMLITAWYIFVKCTKINFFKQVFFWIMFLGMQIPIGYVFSGMSETLGYAIAIALVGLAYKESKQYSFSNLLFQMILCSLYTIIRPYGIAFFVFPLAGIVIHHKYKKMPIFMCIISVSMIGSLKISTLFRATYFENNFSDTGIHLLFEGKITDGISYYGKLIVQRFVEILTGIFQEFNTHVGYLAITYSIVFILFTLTVICGICSKEKNLFMAVGGCSLLIFMAVLFLIEPYYGKRYLLMVCVLLLAALILSEHKYILFTFIGIVIVFLGVKWKEYNYPWTYDREYDEKMNSYSTMFEEAMPINSQKEKKWDNTIIYDMTIPFNWLYCIPDGMGIQFVKKEYLEDTETELKSKYIMLKPNIMSDYPAVIKGNYKLIISTDDFEIWSK